MHRPDAGERFRDEGAVGCGHGLPEGRLGPRQEELLSYLQGLAPVGQEFMLRRAEAMADLGFGADVVFYRALRKLIHAGFVSRLGTGRSHVNGRLKVLRRLEASHAARHRPAPGGRHGRQEDTADGLSSGEPSSDASEHAALPCARAGRRGRVRAGVDSVQPTRAFDPKPCLAMKRSPRTVFSSNPVTRKRP